MRRNTKSLDLNDIISNFKLEKPKKTVWSNYRIKGNELVYNASVTEEKRFSDDKPSARVAEFKKWAKELGAEYFVIGYSKSDTDLGGVITYLENNNWSTIKARSTETNVIAMKVVRDGKTLYLGNSSILPLIGRTVAYGNENRNRSETEIQRIMTRDVDFQMIPFVVFDQAGLDLKEFVLIERGQAETLNHKVQVNNWTNKGNKTTFKVEQRHFTGASLFKVSSNPSFDSKKGNQPFPKTEEKYYLFDVDRREVKHDIFNPFLAQVPGKPKSIKEAYELLKPKAVVEAEKKGLKVLRQGEWFFIPTNAPKIKKLSEIEKMKVLSSGRFGLNEELAKLLKVQADKLKKEAEKLLEGIPRQQNLQAGNSRPNTVEMLLKQGKEIFCSGNVSHTGREHADLKLKGWYKAVANTSTQNVTVTGDID